MNHTQATIRDAAHQYLDRGFMPVPIRPGTKMPIGDDWNSKRYTHPGIEVAFSNQDNIGLMLGEASNGLVDIDLDCQEAIELAPLYLPQTSAVTGRGKNPASHYWYIAPGSKTRQHRDKSTKASIVELRSTGGQTLVGPSVHPDDDIYDMLTEQPSTVPAPMLAACVQSLADAVMELRHGPDWKTKFNPKPKPIIQTETTIDDQQAERRAITYIEKMPRAVSGSGGHGRTYAVATTLVHGFDLPTHTALQILSDHYNPRCEPQWSQRELEHKIDQAAKATDHQKPRGHLRNAQREIETHGVDLSNFMMGQSEDPHSDPRDDGPGPFPKHLLDVPGFIGEVIAHNLATAKRPQPILALGAAISLQAVLCARKVCDELGNRTNLYIVGVGKSASGKEHARQLNKNILFLSGNDALDGNEDIASDAGLFTAVEENPAVLLQLDEFGRFLRTIGDAKKNPHMYNVITLLMRLFSAAQGVYKGKAYADSTRNKSIIQPCVSIYGTTVPGHFYESLTRDSMGDGFVARMMVFESEGTPAMRRAPEMEIPDSIIQSARYWGEYRPSAGNLADRSPKPTIVKADDGAIKVFEDFIGSFDESKVQRGTEIEASIWGRACEKANRLALVHACSRDPESLTINSEDAQWAVDLSRYLTERMMYTASMYVSENKFDEMQKRVIRIIDDAGGSVPQWELRRKTRSMKKRDREELIDNMLETNQIKIVDTPTQGRPRREYILV